MSAVKSSTKVLLFAGTLVLSNMAFATDFNIDRVSLVSLHKKNICIFLGGEAERPTLTIKHSPVRGEKITISLFDETSDGKIYQHGSVSVRSNSNGITVVRPYFFPPCNYTGSTSRYKFNITTKGKNKILDWGSYNHNSGGILKN